MRDRKVVTFGYRAMGDGESSVRSAEPYGLFYLSGHWYLAARDRDRGALRNFRLSRMYRVRRNAARGVRAVAFSEIPPKLGLPSIHGEYWDPLFRACAETGTVVCMHIGSSSTMPTTSLDAPGAVSSTLVWTNSMFSLVDFLLSGVFARFPTLKIAYSEGQAGWLPFVLDRIDIVWDENRAWNDPKRPEGNAAT